MTKRLASKHKVDRRLKANLWGRPKSPFNTRNYKPGQHGKTTKSKISDYGIQLQAKQKLKFYYGNMNERQFRNVYRKALQKRGNTTENFIGLLCECVALLKWCLIVCMADICVSEFFFGCFIGMDDQMKAALDFCAHQFFAAGGVLL